MPLKLETATQYYAIRNILPWQSLRQFTRHTQWCFYATGKETSESLPTPEKPYPLAIFHKSVGKREF